MFLLNVFHYLTLTPSGPRCTTVVTWNELVLYEHLATSTWHQMSSVCGMVECSLEGGCQQVCLEIELRWKVEFPHVS
jgi:hypothetical protein